MPRNATLPRKFKAIHSNSIVGEQGIALIHQRVSGMGFLWEAAGGVEAGIDGTIELRDSETGEVFNSIIRVQSKATRAAFTAETATSFSYLCEERDLDYWLRGNAPVILVVSRPSTDEAYWVSIKDYFRDPAVRRSRKVLFDKQRDCFDSSSRTALAQLALPADRGLYLAPSRKRETLYSNLLRVTSFAPHIYVASTSYRTPDRLWADLRRYQEGAGGEWLLKGGNLVSFQDLRQYPWTRMCDEGSVERFGSNEWATGEDADCQRDFVRLLNEALRAKTRPDLSYHRKEKCFYFSPTAGRTTRHFAYHGPSGKRTSRAVFQSYQSKANAERVYYYRHSAFKGRFREFGASWYLEITPTYHFTHDGRQPHWDQDGLLSGIKRMEHNPAVLGQVIMWAAYLAPPTSLFTEEYPFLKFGSLETFDLEAGIDDAAWLQQDDAEHTAGDQETTETLELF